MPPRMRMTSTATGSIETGNKLGARPVIRQSQIYRETMSGNGVKALLGHDEIMWDESQQEGVFRGMGVHTLETRLCAGMYQAARGAAGETTFDNAAMRPKQLPHSLQSRAVDLEDVPYPKPGCRATCDGCGTVTNVFMHCCQCRDPNLFDLCQRCFAGLYENRGAPLDLARLRRVPAAHPQHDFAAHVMVPVEPPAR